MLPSHPPPSHTLPLDHLDVLSGMTMAILSSPSVSISLLPLVTTQFPLFHRFRHPLLSVTLSLLCHNFSWDICSFTLTWYQGLWLLI